MLTPYRSRCSFFSTESVITTSSLQPSISDPVIRDLTPFLSLMLAKDRYRPGRVPLSYFRAWQQNQFHDAVPSSRNRIWAFLCEIIREVLRRQHFCKAFPHLDSSRKRLSGWTLCQCYTFFVFFTRPLTRVKQRVKNPQSRAIPLELCKFAGTRKPVWPHCWI